MILINFCAGVDVPTEKKVEENKSESKSKILPISLNTNDMECENIGEEFNIKMRKESDMICVEELSEELKGFNPLKRARNEDNAPINPWLKQPKKAVSTLYSDRNYV